MARPADTGYGPVGSNKYGGDITDEIWPLGLCRWAGFGQAAWKEDSCPEWECGVAARSDMMSGDSKDTGLLRAAWRHGGRGTESLCGHDGAVP